MILPTRVKVGDAVICQQIGEEAVLLDMSTHQYFGLNNMGARMWTLLSDLEDPQAVLKALEQIYDVSHEVVEADLTDLVERLVAAGLVSAS